MILSEKIVMIEPRGFSYNEETGNDNFFQSTATLKVPSETALKEFHEFKNKLMKAGIEVNVYSPADEIISPDSVFPNNWFSTTPNGQLILYPMMAANRRLERREELIEKIKKNYSEIIDLTYLEKDELYLEGTGSLVIDHQNKIVFASLSQRTNKKALQEWNKKLNYEINTFESVDQNNEIIYHTNVVMSLADGFAIICLDAIKEKKDRDAIQEKLSSKNELIIISKEQMHSFSGNCIELKNNSGERFIIMSTQAYHAFTERQKNRMIRYATIIHSGLTTIETIGGGSARCMIAELF